MSKEIDPRMHSAEHVLNQTMVRMFGTGRAFSAHIEARKSKCDYRFDRALSGEELRAVESRVNEIIRSDLAVVISSMKLEEARGKIDLNKLPDSIGEVIRIVSIGDYDHCACSGDHVSSTASIGAFRIISQDWNGGVLRIRFKLETP